eukprot:NODE_1666_length_561_cov_498.662109_g1343_i0.p4 GENE.NODE_1666_length_561_cov_498.662109_g1343_i0~~NODE_1666_length_561_cov_498.662109_g1343_i0.p4  ORF type:complete len:51 (+),score=0.14 NODE_1666_length_561_cov_498.662109_g1343_i0:160-312(+)
MFLRKLLVSFLLPKRPACMVNLGIISVYPGYKNHQQHQENVEDVAHDVWL